MPPQPPPSPFSLHGTTILIVGANTPCGTAAARACADRGARVIAHDAFTPPDAPVNGLLYCADETPADLQHAAASRLLAPAQAIQHLLSSHLLRDGGAIALQKLSGPGVSLEGGLHPLACSLALAAAPHPHQHHHRQSSTHARRTAGLCPCRRLSARPRQPLGHRQQPGHHGPADLMKNSPHAPPLRGSPPPKGAACHLGAARR